MCLSRCGRENVYAERLYLHARACVVCVCAPGYVRASGGVCTRESKGVCTRECACAFVRLKVCARVNVRVRACARLFVCVSCAYYYICPCVDM